MSLKTLVIDCIHGLCDDRARVVCDEPLNQEVLFHCIIDDMRRILSINNGDVVRAYEVGQKIIQREHDERVERLDRLDRLDMLPPHLVPVPRHVARPAPWRVSGVLKGEVSEDIRSALNFICSVEAMEYLRSRDADETNPILVMLIARWDMFVKQTEKKNIRSITRKDFMKYLSSA